MKSYIFVVLALLAHLVFASNLYPDKSTFYGCPQECETEKNPKCEMGLPDNRFFVALHKKYFQNMSKYCGSYWVGMIIDDKAKNDATYKMARAMVVDQCGSCSETQVDLSFDVFKTMANGSTGVVSMVYVIVDKKSSEIIDGPHYNSSALKRFAEKQGVSRETIIESFKQAAKKLNAENRKGLSDYPWKSSSYAKEEKKTTKKTTTTTKKTTTTTTKKTTTTIKKTTVEEKKTTTIKQDVPKHTTTVAPAKPTKAEPTKAEPTKAEPAKTEPAKTEPAKTEQTKDEQTKDEPTKDEPTKDEPAKVEPTKDEPTKAEPTKDDSTKPNTNDLPLNDDDLDEFDRENGGTNAFVGAGIIGVCGAAGVGLLMLKRKSPQKYDELKQKFPEAFGNVKRSLTRGASTIKRGVSRSISRSGRNNTPANQPKPTNYNFNLSSEDGLPRVALYDDPYPTKTRGSQHW